VGKYADLIVLPDNPLAVAPERLVEMEVQLTMVGGRVAFCALPETMCDLFGQ
jgi:predicted amidohydrolase YtcJ